MAITKSLFGTMPSGEKVYCYTLDNGLGLSAEILSLGGIIKNLYVTDKNVKKVDVVLGHDTLEQYLTKPGYFGAAIGRNSNRIKNCAFELNGKTYKLADTGDNNNLHGGIVGFDKKVWDIIEEDGVEPALVMSITSPDGDEGFPGNLDLTMTYTLTKDNSLEIHYIAKSDADTVVNLTNHSYFNIGGHDSGAVYDHILQMNSDFYTPNDESCVPTGEIVSTSGTPFDFREEKRLGDSLLSDAEQIKLFNGIDHNFTIRGRGLRHFATITCKETGISMETISDMPGVQIYAANGLEADSYKNGATYGNHNAVCFETQHFPNAIAFSHFPSPILKKDEEYNSKTIYKFTVN